MSRRFHAVQVGYNRFFIDERYTNLSPCGDGSYGFVVSAMDTMTGKTVAIKKIKDVFSDLIDAKRILREVKLLQHFNSHENIVTILDIMTVPPNKIDFEDIYIVTNLMESDLERIIRSKQGLTDQHFQYFLYQILRALKYIHSANVLHRDLKPSNLLVNANCDLAVCDFGLARGFDADSAASMTEYVVTRWYRAPELLCEATHYGKPVDIWGVGCIFAELITYEAFFQGDNPQRQLEVIVSKLGAGTPLALDLIRRMLQFHPDDRISVEEALAHPYLKDFHGQMPEPESEKLFDFDFEKCESDMYVEMTKYEVQTLMYAEMLVFRPDSNSPLSKRRSTGSTGSSSKRDDDDDEEEEMVTAREDKSDYCDMDTEEPEEKTRRKYK